MDPVHILMDPVHGIGPRRGSMDRGSMFCTFPIGDPISEEDRVVHLLASQLNRLVQHAGHCF